MEPKPGLKTSELYLLGATGAILYDSNILSDPSPFVRLGGVVTFGFMAMMYAYSRMAVKGGKP